MQKNNQQKGKKVFQYYSRSTHNNMQNPPYSQSSYKQQSNMNNSSYQQADYKQRIIQTCGNEKIISSSINHLFSFLIEKCFKKNKSHQKIVNIKNTIIKIIDTLAFKYSGSIACTILRCMIKIANDNSEFAYSLWFHKAKYNYDADEYNELTLQDASINELVTHICILMNPIIKELSSRATSSYDNEVANVFASAYRFLISFDADAETYRKESEDVVKQIMTVSNSNANEIEDEEEEVEEEEEQKNNVTNSPPININSVCTQESYEDEEITSTVVEEALMKMNISTIEHNSPAEYIFLDEHSKKTINELPAENLNGRGEDLYTNNTINVFIIQYIDEKPKLFEVTFPIEQWNSLTKNQLN